MPPVISPQSANWSTIILAIRQQIVANTGLSNTLVRIVANANYNVSYPDDKYIVILSGGLQPDTDSGEGRRARAAYRNIRFYIYTRSNVDMIDDDLHALTDDGAHGDFEEAIFNCLDEFTPTNLAGTVPLTIEPLHPTDSTEGLPFREAEDDAEGLVRSEITFQARYVLPNTWTVPTPNPPPVNYPE